MALTKVSPAVVPINQPTSSTCWYVCLQMLWIWKKKDPKDILTLLNADPDLYPDYWLTNGIAPGDCRPAARALGMGCAGDGDIDAGVLARALRSHGPYWVAGMWVKGHSHVIVVTACDENSGAIRYINPWNNFDLSDSPGDIDWLNSRGDVWKSTFGSCIYWV
jgi:hypothetical protein